MHAKTFSRLPLITATLSLLTLPFPFTTATFFHAGIYGTPNIQDCLQALSWIPYARLAPSYPLSQQLHVIAEPQFLSRPFGALDNPYRPSAIIQVPKVFKWNSCRVAIVSQGTLGQVGARTPVFVASWRSVIDQAARLRGCLAGGSPRGGYTSFQLSGGSEAAGLYMYTSQSPFAVLDMNNYMSLGRAITPISSYEYWASLGNGSAGGSFVNSSSCAANLTVPGGYVLPEKS